MTPAPMTIASKLSITVPNEVKHLPMRLRPWHGPQPFRGCGCGMRVTRSTCRKTRRCSARSTRIEPYRVAGGQVGSKTDPDHQLRRGLMPSPSRNAGKWRMGAGEFGTGKLERVKGEPFPASNPLIDNMFLQFTPRNQARLRTTAVGPATTDRPSPSCGGYPQPSKSEAMGGQVSRDRQVSMATATPSCIHAPSAPSAGALMLFTRPMNRFTAPEALPCLHNT